MVFLAGFGVNTVFVALGIHGYLREASRLTTLVGVFLILLGLAQGVVGKLSKRKSK